MKKKVLKIIQVVYDILSLVFIVFVCVAMAVSPKTDNSHNELKENNIVNPIRKTLNSGYDNYKLSFQLRADFPTSWAYTLDGTTNTFFVKFTNDCKMVVYNGYYFDFTLSLENALVTYNNQISNIDYNELKIGLSFESNKANLKYIRLINDDTSLDLWHVHNGFNYSNVSILFNNYDFGSYNVTPYGDTFYYLGFFEIFFISRVNENVNYSFDNQVINPINYYSYQIMGDNTAHNVGSYTGHIDLDMVFLSNGRTFKGIRFQYDYVLGSYYKGNLTTYDDMTYLALSYIAYQDFFTNEWVKVCYPRIYKYETRSLNNVSNLYGYPFTDFNTYIWSSDSYKDILILSGKDNVFSTAVGDPIANLTNIQVLTYKGELNSSVVIGGNANANVFSLLSSAFGSLTSIFAITLIPGLTIGTLMFLPLVVLVIFAIIRIIHK